MKILINQDGKLNLEEPDDFNRFSIVDLSPTRERKALDAISVRAGDDHYWIDAEAVIDLSNRSHDPEWIDLFWSMLKKVEPYGYADLENRRVKAHIETQD